MKILVFFVPLLLLCATSVQSQSSDSLVGSYKIVMNAGPKTPSVPALYCVLQKNSVFIWGVDANGRDSSAHASSGTWFYTLEHEIKLVPDSSSAIQETRYFAEVGGGKFVFRSVDKNGHKERIKRMESTLSLIRVQ